MKQITPSIFHTGVLNPSMRIFDVVMHTEYGTSYNSYVVKGSEKTAIIEGAHSDFFNYFLENLEGVLGKNAKIDYLVLNHTEPDHSGCVAEFIKAYPDITVVASPAAAIYLKNITNMSDLKVQVVKDKDSISLGDKTLEFINAPFLHWPDSMFTWVPEEKTLFSCDFLGAHFCEPQLYDYNIIKQDEFWKSFKYYYDCIFSPFKQYVAAGLTKIKDLDIEFACTSHGPVLTKGNGLKKAIELYTEWSTPAVRDHKLVPIFYCTAYGNTEKLAKQAKEGILSVFPNAEVETFDIIYHDMSKLHHLLNECDAALIGTLTINKDAVPPIWNLLAGIEAVNFKGKPIALFGSFGWSGEAFANVAARLESVKANVFEKQYKVNFVPREDEQQGARDFAIEFAKSLADS